MHSLNIYLYVTDHKWALNTHPVFITAVHLRYSKEGDVADDCKSD